MSKKDIVFTRNKGLSVIVDKVNLSEFYTSLTWAGSKSEVARSVEIELIQNDSYYIPKVKLELHKLVQVFISDVEIFRGYIFDIEKTLQNSTIRIKAYDGGIFLLKSKSYCKFKGKTPEDVTRMVCAEVNVPVGKLEKAKPYDRIHDGDTIYEIIMTGYTLDSQSTGKHYYAYMHHGRLNIARKGTVVFKYVLDSSHDLIDATYKMNSEEAVNKVKAYDEQGNLKAMFTLKDYKNFPGILQDIYKGTNPNEGKLLLKKASVEIAIEGLGFIECVTGKAVTVYEPVTGLTGIFYIDSDTHTFSDGVHKMSLDLSLNNIMDRHEAGSEKEEVQEDSEGLSSRSSGSSRKFKNGDGKYTGKMTWPVPSTGYITCYFGWVTVNGQTYKHRGIDIGGGIGATIVAADGGQVIHAGYGEDSTYGISVCISHGRGVFTRYAHMSAVSVCAGQSVSKGQKIGAVGNTGHSFGPHLHFEVIIGNKWNEVQNPLNYVRYGR